MITSEGDEVQVSAVLIALQARGHEVRLESRDAFGCDK
jgi:hypothetical protein